MRINWEEFEETLQELSEELGISHPIHSDFVQAFTEAVDELIESHKLKSKDQDRAIELATDYGYKTSLGEDEDNIEDDE